MAKDRSNKGIALLQVLLISTIISILALYFSSTARDYVKLASLSNDRAEAYLAIKTAQSRLMLTLLTEIREAKIASTANNALLSHWNFYNQPFSMSDGVTASIQDQSGLISLHFPDPQLLRNTFEQNNLDPTFAPIVVDSLLDWQDADKLTRLNGAEESSYKTGPRNALVSIKSEIAWVNGMFEVWPHFADIFTVYQRSPFNPMTAPPALLAGLIGQDRANEYLAQRKLSTLDVSQFSALTGIQETIEQILYPGDVLEIRLQAKRGQVNLSKTMMVEVKPYIPGNQSPIDYLEVRW